MKTIFDFCKTEQEVIDCWKIVYESYYKAGFIKENSHSIFTYKEAIKPNTLVVYAKQDGEIVSTLSVILPPTPITARKEVTLNWEEVDYSEVSLFASKEGFKLGLSDLLNMFGIVYWYTISQDLVNIVIETNPKNHKVFSSLFYMEKISKESSSLQDLNGAPADVFNISLVVNFYKKTLASKLFSKRYMSKENFSEALKLNDNLLRYIN